MVMVLNNPQKKVEIKHWLKIFENKFSDSCVELKLHLAMNVLVAFCVLDSVTRCWYQK